MDYESTLISATFTAGSTNTTVNISIITDNIVENPELFGIQLNITDTLMFKNQIILGNDGICVIEDNTSKKHLLYLVLLI